MRYLTAPRSSLSRAFGFVAAGFHKVMAGASLAFAALVSMLYAGVARAAGSPGGAMAAELAGGKDEVLAIIVILAAIVGVILIWKYVRRAG